MKRFDELKVALKDLTDASKNILGRWIPSGGLFSWGPPKQTGANSSRRGRSSRDALGVRGEHAAAKFLKRKGYRIVAHSHRQRLGEIDLIAIDGNCIVFVEVKTWRDDSKADPSEAVNHAKQRKLTRAALVYLKEKRLLDQPARFDVVSVVWPESERRPQFRHFENAFEAVGSGQMYN
ncbi:MAG: YraN family protein [Pirellulaceae bacterium]